MMYAINTTCAVTAAVAPAHVELPTRTHSTSLPKLKQKDTYHTFEDGIQSKEVDADRTGEHGQGEAEEFDDDRSVVT